ncbi:MAG: hypothetical protein JXB50_13425 [Spirochaetes bacterium]|nr:hypothetical protein [Spirochaetota bacterium]
MKKIAFLSLLIFFNIYAFSQTTAPDNTSDLSDIQKIKNELDAIKKDVEELKNKTSLFNFRIEGSVKTTYGLNFWARHDRNNKEGIKHVDQMTTVINNGFDFENRIKLYADLGNKVIASSNNKYDNGTEISIDLELKSRGISKIKPDGSWYVVQGRDDQDNTTDIYLPRYDNVGSNVFFGNLEIAVKEAKVKNILGTGFFVSFKDVQEVNHYYGITGLVDILKYNHDYFNNGFIYKYDYENGKIAEYGSLFYSFDYEDYEPESTVAEAMKLWSNSSLHYDPDNSDYNQEPHGISFGLDKRFSSNFNLFFEAGIASKDAFDPKYFKDDNVDYGFFARLEPRFFDKMNVFHPKVSFSYAMQSRISEDYRWEWSSLAAAVSIPYERRLSVKRDDIFKIAFNFNLNYYIHDNIISTIFSLIPEFVLLNEKLFFSLPIIYSYKSPGNYNFVNGGFQRIGHKDVKWIDQLYDNHIINLNFQMGFDSKNLFGDIFQYRIINNVYFAYLREWYEGWGSNNYYSYYPDTSEVYFFEILRNEFILNDIVIEKLVIYADMGYGFSNNAKVIYQSTPLKYSYDREGDIWEDTLDGEQMKWKRWNQVWVMSYEIGAYVDIVKNFSIGLSFNSPKILMNELKTDSGNSFHNPIGNQNSYVLMKLWSEIRF